MSIKGKTSRKRLPLSFTGKEMNVKTQQIGPGPVAHLITVSSWKAKGCGFDSQAEHIARLQL